MEPTRITVELPHFEGFDITNDDRAAMVDPLIQAFAAAYYHADFAPGEPLVYYIVADLLCDLMHWCDRVPVADGDEIRPVMFDDHLHMARANHDEEWDEEHVRLVCSGCGRVGTPDDLCYHGEGCPDDERGGTMHIYREDSDATE